MSDIKTGTNGVAFGPGYKGKGMCAACMLSAPKVIWVGGPPQLMCRYYAATCRSVSRNCTGIKSFKKP
jgi:hypothetical protein